MGLHATTLFNRQGVTLPDSFQPLIIAGFILSIALTGYLTLSYLALSRNLLWTWTILVTVWAIAVVAGQVSQAPAMLSEQGTILPFPQISLGLEILFFGWLVLALTLFGLVARAFLGEPLPLYANRILFWYVVVPFLLLGDALAAWVSPPWNYVGYGIRLLGTVAAVYGVVSHRIVDLRDSVRRLISYSLLTIVTSALVLVGIIAYINVTAALGPDVTRLWLVAVLISFGIAILVQPVRRFLGWLLRHLIERDQADVAEAVRLYSQRVGAILDLKEFASTAARTADELLSARRGCLIMATQQNDQIALETVGTDRVDTTAVGHMSATSPIYQHFTSTSDAVLQYDIDYQKDYRSVSSAERKYFSSLQMDIFAPIIKDGKLIGILALGPKLNDDPYRSGEIVLISALANQTVTALENARLVTDLRSLNTEISSLNEDLRQTNERLERLDSVKSDFISIASHELRTPLTQIRVRRSLLEMSERNLLSPDQTIEITGSLRAASQRMGEVISSMLDVSQIDVENMDLSFVETSLASIIKLAIEPYSDAIHQRNLTLVARGLRNLPPIYGDYKRLVQAFEALITNAMFTPDGARSM
jgi:GAF domain-containing protein